jgi:quinol monooxygenase YgiN
MRICLLMLTIALLPWTAALSQTPQPGPAAAAPQPEAKSRATTFVVKFKVKPGKNAAFETAFTEMQAAVRAHEPGNVYYDFFVSDQDPQTYVIIERYRDAAAISAHGASEYGKKLFATLRDLLDGPPDAQRLILISAN